MRFYLETNQSKFNQKYKAGLSSQIWVPLNAGRSVGADNAPKIFKTRPDTDSVNLASWITQQITLGNIDITPSLGDTVLTTTDAQTVSGAKTFTANIAANSGITVDGTAFVVADTSGDVSTEGTLAVGGDSTLSGDIVFSEVVAAPATSANLSIKSGQVVHTISGGATEEIAVNVPDGAVLLGANLLVSVVLGFTTGTAVTATWTNSTQQIGGTDALAAKNSKVTALYDANGTTAVATGTPETITLTADAGTVDSGEVVVTFWYMELSDLTDVA